MRLERCLAEVSHWMSTNHLKLNPDRQNYFGLVQTTASRQLLGITGLSLQTDSDSVMASDHVHMLGMIITPDLNFAKHCSSLCAACFFWLHQLRRVRWSLTDSASTQQLALARCGRSSPLQARRDSLMVSAQQSAPVPHTLLHHSLGNHQSSATSGTLSTPTPAGLIMLPMQHTRPSGMVYRQTHHLEVASR